jgi:GAF domain-containing protein
VLEPDLRHRPRRAWPALASALREDPVGSLFAFPLVIGGVRFGALDLYHDRPTVLSDQHTEQVTAMVDLISRYVLQRAVRLAGELEESGETRHSRRVVHQATGFVVAQLDVSPEDAHLLIQGQALSQGRSMAEIADDIVERRLSFTMNDDRIEEKT